MKNATKTVVTTLAACNLCYPAWTERKKSSSKEVWDSRLVGKKCFFCLMRPDWTVLTIILDPTPLWWMVVAASCCVAGPGRFTKVNLSQRKIAPPAVEAWKRQTSQTQSCVIFATSVRRKVEEKLKEEEEKQKTTKRAEHIFVHVINCE